MKSLLLLLTIVFTAAGFAQGPLTPPSAAGPEIGTVPPLDGLGNPQPSMKTLHQVEPRKAVQTLAASAPYTISAPGSYYLTGNITVASGDAIVISSDNVTLDLNGFAIRSSLTGSAAGTAVSMTGNRSAITIRNGSILSSTTVPASGPSVQGGFRDGIYGEASEALISGIHIVGTGRYGIYIAGVVERCTAENCGLGIQAGEVRDCIANNCYGAAIYADTVIDSKGVSVTETGVGAVTAFNCQGTSTGAFGLSAPTAINCFGRSTSSIGLDATCATNCSGLSTTGIGLRAALATNCNGETGGNTSAAIGLWCFSTANGCFGKNSVGSTAISLKAEIAVGCTFSGTTPVVPAGKSFNM